MTARYDAERRAKDAVAWLKRHGRESVRKGMARYGIPADHAVGVPVGMIRGYAKTLGRDHAVAAALWASGGYEVRLLACFVDDPTLVTPEQMDRWCRDFDDWATCDTACFHLFDRTPHAWKMVRAWAGRRPEFERRAAFALLASLALHDKAAADEPFRASLAHVERAATDPRNFVKKAVSWALRGVGHRSPDLHAAALALARRLAASGDAAARWIGKDAERDLTRPAVVRKLASSTKGVSRAPARPSRGGTPRGTAGSARRPGGTRARSRGASGRAPARGARGRT
jgi:3-methyladenine DNA glycosylase AlkD